MLPLTPIAAYAEPSGVLTVCIIQCLLIGPQAPCGQRARLPFQKAQALGQCQAHSGHKKKGFAEEVNMYYLNEGTV